MTKLAERIYIAIVATFLLFMLSVAVTTAQAQVGCEPTGDGAVFPNKSAVKKIGDAFRLSWAAPTQLADADCTPIASDPAFAITSYEVYAEVGTPAQAGPSFPPLATLPATQRELTGTLNFATLRPGSDVYFAVAACNEFGCSRLSEQPWVKVGGPPGKATGLNAQ